MDNKALYSIFGPVIYCDDVSGVRHLLNQHPSFLRDGLNGGTFLRIAARRNNVEMAAILAEFGADVNAPQLNGSPEGNGKRDRSIY